MNDRITLHQSEILKTCTKLQVIRNDILDMCPLVIMQEGDRETLHEIALQVTKLFNRIYGRK